MALLVGLAAGTDWAPVDGLPLDQDDGVPTIRHFPPREIGGGPQVLSLVQSLEGTLVVATNRTVLEYDGARWRRLRLDSPPRQLGLDGEGRVWVGLHDDFGLVDLSGPELRFESKLEGLAEDTRNLGRAIGLATAGDTLHLAFERRWLRWNPKVGLVGEPWPDSGTVEAVASDGEALWFALAGRGLLHLPTAAAEPRLIAEARLGAPITALLPLDAGDLLGATADGALRRWRDGAWEPVSPQVEALLAGRGVTTLSRLAGGEIVLGSQGAGLILLDAEGQLQRHFDASAGLPSEMLYAAYQGHQGALWLGTSAGVVRLAATPLSFFDHEGEAPNSVISVQRHQGELLLGALEGPFRLVPAEAPDPARFEPLVGVEGVVTSWASTPVGLAAGSSRGLYVDTATGWERRLDQEASVAWSPSTERLLVASAPDLKVLRHDGSEWVEVVSHPGLEQRIFEIVPDGPDRIWLTTFGNRVLFRLSFPNGLEEPPQISTLPTQGPYPQLLHFEGDLLVRDLDRVLRPSSDLPIEDWTPDPRFEVAQWRAPQDDRFKLRPLGDDALWLVSRNRLGPLAAGDEGVLAPEGPRHGLPVDLNFDSHPDPDNPGVLWLATERGPARLSTTALVAPRAEPRIRFRPPAAAELGPSTAGVAPRLRFNSGTYHFDCASPVLRSERSTEYRYRLVGLSEDWTEWTTKASKEYTNLWSGRYRFEVETRHAGVPTGASSYAFRVVAPWYWGWPGWLLYGLMAAVGYAVVVRRHRQRFERERLIAERERAISRRLRAVDRLKDEVLLETSLGLRAPLSGIAGLAESLADGAKGELASPVREDLQMIAASGRRLGVLVDDVLDLSKLRDQSLELDCRPVDLHPLVDVVLTVSRPLVGNKKLDLLNRVDPELPTVLADESRLQQVLTNLLSNAIRYTDRGSVVISARLDGDLVRLSVSDTGVGIRRDRHEQIFRSFEDSQETVGAGVGLGLALGRRLVELHGGTLEVESELGQGATFTLSLPLGGPPAVEGKSGAPITAAPPGVASAAGAVSERLVGERLVERSEEARPFRILIADDEPVNRQILINILSQGPYVLDVTTSGEEALAHLGAEQPDLALLDIMMPRISGYEVCRAIREDYPRLELPVIFLTAKSQPADLVAGYRAGANDYLVKPVNKDELLMRVDTHLELLRVHRDLERLVQERTAQLELVSGLLPLCSMCKKIRDDEGYWREVVDYINVHTEAEFSHGICPACLEEHYEFLTGTPRSESNDS